MTRKPTIYEALAAKLGRNPTNKECKIEIIMQTYEAIGQLKTADCINILYATLTNDRGQSVFRTKRAAERLARNYRAKHMMDSWAQEV